MPTHGHLARPDWTRSLGPHLSYPLDLDSPLCRVYDRESALQQNYSCLSWNPTQNSGAAVGGRFDATPADAFGYIYGAECDDGTDVAIYETLYRLVRLDTTTGIYAISRAELDVYSIGYFNPMSYWELADCSAQGLHSMRVPEEVVTHGDRDLTREWGSYLRSSLPGQVVGLAYNSRLATYSMGGRRSFVLWSDRITTPNFTAAKGDLRLDTTEGRRLVLAVFKRNGMPINLI